jgi:predicted nucleic acid-binding protein
VDFYVDTSVLVAMVIDEPRSSATRSWWKRAQGRMIVADLAAIEFVAVISRGVRTQRFDVGQASEILADMGLLRAECAQYSHAPGDFALAEQLVRDFSTKLAAPDALHLSAAINTGAALATLDERLSEAARAKGVEAVALTSSSKR